MLSLVLPKGSLERSTLELFDAADLTVRRASERDYHASVDDPRIDRVRFLRPQEIPTYVAEGLFDFGITGRDWITETGADVASLGELAYSKATSDPVRVVLAVPANSGWNSITDLPDGIRISTELPSLTRRLLIANHVAFSDPDKRAAMEDVALLLRGAIRARGNVLLKLNVADAQLEAVTDILPAMSSPTITSLARGDMHAVEAVVPKRGVNTLIPALRAAGARDILEIPISKIIE